MPFRAYRLRGPAAPIGQPAGSQIDRLLRTPLCLLPAAARRLTALLVLRQQVTAPIAAGVRSPRQGRKPKCVGHRSIATTRSFVSTCSDSSPTSASRPSRRSQHRQQIVDRRRQAPSSIHVVDGHPISDYRVGVATAQPYEMVGMLEARVVSRISFRYQEDS